MDSVTQSHPSATLRANGCRGNKTTGNGQPVPVGFSSTLTSAIGNENRSAVTRGCEAIADTASAVISIPIAAGITDAT